MDEMEVGRRGFLGVLAAAMAAPGTVGKAVSGSGFKTVAAGNAAGAGWRLNEPVDKPRSLIDVVKSQISEDTLQAMTSHRIEEDAHELTRRHMGYCMWDNIDNKEGRALLRKTFKSYSPVMIEHASRQDDDKALMAWHDRYVINNVEIFHDLVANMPKSCWFNMNTQEQVLRTFVYYTSGKHEKQLFFGKLGVVQDRNPEWRPIQWSEYAKQKGYFENLFTIYETYQKT